MRRYGCVAGVLLIALGLLLCLVGGIRSAGAAPAAAATEADPIVIDFPTQIPYPTQIPIPTWCATPLVDGPAVCGVAAVAVSHANGEGGYALAQAAALLFGLGFIGVCIVVGQFIRR